MPEKLASGLWGEKVAAKWLIDNGYKLIGSRVRAGRHGELDIIVQKDNILAFVEVKTRASELYGRPAQAVNAEKRRALCAAAAAYLRRVNYPELVYRFDIVEVIGKEKMYGEPVVRHINDAFRLPIHYRFNRRKPEDKCPGFLRRLFL